MKGKWARGIAPRFFAWIIKDKLAVSERPGGYARNHRRVRRQEEILWLRGEGFTRVVSLLTSPHNLHAYDELDMAWAHIPFGSHDDPSVVLPDLYCQVRDWMASGERLLVHQEELNDRLMGVVAGYLRWSDLVPLGPQAISVVERIMHRQMGPDGRELVAMAPQLAGAGNSAMAPAAARGRVSESFPRPRDPASTRAQGSTVSPPVRRPSPEGSVPYADASSSGADAPSGGPGAASIGVDLTAPIARLEEPEPGVGAAPVAPDVESPPPPAWPDPEPEIAAAEGEREPDDAAAHSSIDSAAKAFDAASRSSQSQPRDATHEHWAEADTWQVVPPRADAGDPPAASNSADVAHSEAPWAATGTVPGTGTRAGTASGTSTGTAPGTGTGSDAAIQRAVTMRPDDSIAPLTAELEATDAVTTGVGGGDGEHTSA